LHVPKGLQDGRCRRITNRRVAGEERALFARHPIRRELFTRHENRFAPPAIRVFHCPYDYRLTEHQRPAHVAFSSAISRVTTGLFAEMSPELATELKIKNGDHISIVSLRVRSNRGTRCRASGHAAQRQNGAPIAIAISLRHVGADQRQRD